jgi:protein-S-isoprenylcysteine O-methyltransferase Ste14
MSHVAQESGPASRSKLELLVGCGHKIGLVVAPVLLIGGSLNVLFPAVFTVGGPPRALQLLSAAVLALGLVNWVESVILILRHVPRRELITTGPYAWVKHPLYTGVALLVLPWLGFLLNSWLGALLGAALYAASRRYSPEEERELEATFGPAWDAYCSRVRIPWL